MKAKKKKFTWIVFVALRTKKMMTGDTTSTTAKMAHPIYVLYLASMIFELTSSLWNQNKPTDSEQTHTPKSNKQFRKFSTSNRNSIFILIYNTLPNRLPNFALNFSQIIQIACHHIKIPDCLFNVSFSLLIFNDQTASVWHVRTSKINKIKAA